LKIVIPVLFAIESLPLTQDRLLGLVVHLNKLVISFKSWNKEDNMERTWIQTVTLS
jgi:hypothetical protein